MPAEGGGDVAVIVTKLVTFVPFAYGVTRGMTSRLLYEMKNVVNAEAVLVTNDVQSPGVDAVFVNPVDAGTFAVS